MAERKAPETKPEAQREDEELHATGGSKVSINKFALLNFVLDASADRIKSFHLETERTLGRLKVKGWRNSRVYTKAGRGVGGNPPLHDIILWLDSLEVGDKYASDIAFLKRLHNTLCTRLGV